MSLIAPTLEAFFSERLAKQRLVSSHTVAAYRDTFRLLLVFCRERTGKAPSKLAFEDVDASLVSAFLEHLENNRGNSVVTRNARLAALHSFFRFSAYRHPEHGALIQRVLAIPHKRFERTLISFLERPEFEAVLAAPDRSTWVGRRDHALLLLALQTGFRVSELSGLRHQDVDLDRGHYVRCTGKGRKERCTPLTAQTVAVLRVWLRECTGSPTDMIFPSRHGGRLSSDAIQRLVAKYVQLASHQCPSLRGKSVTPHVLRHTSAMNLLHSGVDTTVIALWLGHEGVRTTQVYLHADLALKERALARTAPVDTKSGRFHPPDSLLAFLESV
ncbi:MAG: tyrosine-type recombinase/integrase [Candidatus Dormibacteria bacterium]